MAVVTAAEALPAVLLVMNKQELIGTIQVHRITEANEMRESDPLGQLNCEVLNTITCTWKSPVPTPREAEDLTKRAKRAARV